MELGIKGKKVLITGGSKGIGKAIKEELEKEGAIVTSISREEGYDVMKEEDMGRIARMIQDSDILINNVGGMGTAGLEDWFEVFQKNFMTAFILTMAFLRPGKTWGRVITISSVYGKEKGGTPWFNAAKSAQISLNKNLAGRYEGITFNTISPGFINTKESIEQYAKDRNVPLGLPEDIAHAVIFLCSDKASFINGNNLVIDGGYSYSF